MVINDRRLTISHLANIISISQEQVENILHNKLGMSKVLAQWVPWLFTPDQKLTRFVMSEANLARFEADLDRFVELFLTQGECWVHHFEPETKRPKGNPYSGSTQLLLLQRRPRWCHLQAK